MNPVPRRLAAYLDFIQSQIETWGYPPTFRELQEGVGLASLNSTHANVLRLRAHGLLLDGGGARAQALPGPPTVLPCKRCQTQVRHYAIRTDHQCAVPFRGYVPLIHTCH